MEQKIVLRFMDLGNTEESTKQNQPFLSAHCSDPSGQSFKESLYPPSMAPVAFDHIQR